jgi:hypothetical protein
MIALFYIVDAGARLLDNARRLVAEDHQHGGPGRR